MSSSTDTRMSAKAILTPRVNSHPFQERSVSLDQPLKIGRSVARSRPGASNAIFDCKVLSRNHALMWYEAGKFYLQDTKSSNGTFVNNVRLSKSSEESPPTQITSGDVLQFGVDVMELTKKVTHGCIVATLQLFTPDGKEAKGPSMSEKPATTLQDIYALHHFIREAAEREEKLESKINEMGAILLQTNEALETGWKALIEEDRLLTRVDILERQLQACHKSMTEDKLREEVIELLGDKEKYQEAAKEALRKSLAEKLEAVKRHQELERALRNGEDEREFLRETSDKAKEELDKLAVKTELVEKNFVDVMQEMELMSLKYKEEVEALTMKLEQEQELSRDKDDLIKVMTAEQNQSPSFSPPFKDVVSLHNHNEDEDMVAENEKDGFSLDQTTVEKLDANAINDELTELRKRLKLIESDKALICDRLQHIQEMFQDVYTRVNNNPYTDVNILETLNRVEKELRQIKNGIAFLEPKFSPSAYSADENLITPESNNYLFSAYDEFDGQVKDIDAERRELVKQNGESASEQLLADARDTILLLERRIASQQQESVHKEEIYRLLQEQKEVMEADYQSQIQQILCAQKERKTDELKVSKIGSQIAEGKEANNHEPDNSNAKRQERSKLTPEVETVSLNDAQDVPDIFEKSVQEEHHQFEKDQEQRRRAEERVHLQHVLLGKEDREDLKKVTKQGHDLSSQVSVGSGKALDTLPNGSFHDDLNDNKASRERILIQKQLLNMEEELAVYKDRYLSCVNENSYVKKELLELQNQQQHQHKRLLFLIPFSVVLLLAILIVLNPLT